MNVYIVLVLQMVIASGTYLIAKTVARDIEPFALTMLRNTIAAIGLIGIYFLREKKIRIERADRHRIILLGFLAIWMNQFLFLFGMRYTTPANAALLYAATPIFVMLFSYFMKKEIRSQSYIR
jgi:drug/metabolite transporter (DMT)-like permease